MLGSHFPRSTAVLGRLKPKHVILISAQRSLKKTNVGILPYSRLFSSITSNLNDRFTNIKLGLNIEHGGKILNRLVLPKYNHSITRQFSFTSVPKFLFKTLRIPAGIVGMGVGAVTYFNNMVQEATRNLVPEWLREAAQEAGGFFGQAREGGGKFFDEADAFFSSFFAGKEHSSYGSSGDGGNSSYDPPPPPFGLDDDRKQTGDGGDDGKRAGSTLYSKKSSNFSPLIRKLIEVRAILKLVDDKHRLELPSIVVIGSQSSGKSSVLEAIVGREFLPKGSNMVTRRPIELTLIHSPELTEEYGILPQISHEKIRDFEEIKGHLSRLNQAVPADQCVSKDPIELKIYSPSVPDLTLIDLPGYIQVNTKDQPRYLKARISELCEKYINQNNIILAVCPADVDLANSEALLASRRVDPKGARTIGVITKLDLVDPLLGAAILDNRDYPLQLGYFGVVCAKSKHTALDHPAYRGRGFNVGIPVLQQMLVQTLESRLASNLHQLNDALQADLEEVRYQYKVEYNDRMITAESYVADSMDILKHRFKDFAASFGKAQISNQIQATLEQKVLDVCARMYWADAGISQLGRDSITDAYWQGKLDQASALLTKCGVGKLSTQLVVDTLMYHMDKISRAEPFVHHDDMRRKIIQFSNDIVKQKLKSTVDQVENTIKPYKFAVDCNTQEWSEARARTIALLKQEITMCDTSLSKIKQAVGTSKLRAAVNYLQAHAPADQAVHFSPKLLAKAREAAWLRDRRMTLRFRLAMSKSRGCKNADNKTMCPEIYLNMVSSKLTSTAVMFIKVELLDEVFFQFPREVDTHLLYYGLTKDQIAQFARQNPKIARQLQLKDSRAHLEHAASKLSYLIREMEN